MFQREKSEKNEQKDEDQLSSATQALSMSHL